MNRDQSQIVIAGATGSLGQLVTKYLRQQKASVKALVRANSDRRAVETLIALGADAVEVDFNNPLSLVHACLGANCVVSTLSGVRDTIVDTQTRLLRAAIDARVKRFIPSDFCIDYRRIDPGDNRNLDLRREFSVLLDQSSIRPTSILNGMFTDLLAGQAPVILHKQKRIFFWGNADQKMDFTTMDNTAQFTAFATLDDNSPRWLTIAGDVASMRDIQRIASEVTGEKFKLLRPGGLGAFRVVITVTKALSPGKSEPFPAWQGMQYLYDMLTGIPKFSEVENQRYAGIHWETIADIIRSSRRY
jgi:uncharacterized protein YbjT (DUF2867 family)